MENEQSKEPRQNGKRIKPHHYKIAALLALIIPVGALFTNGTFVDGEIVVQAVSSDPIFNYGSDFNSYDQYQHNTLAEGGSGGTSITEILNNPECKDGVGIKDLPTASSADVSNTANYNPGGGSFQYVDQMKPYDVLRGDVCHTDVCQSLANSYETSAAALKVTAISSGASFSISGTDYRTGTANVNITLNVPLSNIYNAQGRTVTPVCGSGCTAFRSSDHSTIIMSRRDSNGNLVNTAVINGSQMSDVGGDCLVSASNTMN